MALQPLFISGWKQWSAYVRTAMLWYSLKSYIQMIFFKDNKKHSFKGLTYLK